MKKLVIGVFAILAMGFYACEEDTAFEENPEFVPTATGENPQTDKIPGGGTGGNGGGSGGGGSQNFLADTAKQKRVAVLEDFTGVKCQYCPDGARRAETIKQSLGSNFIIIATHGGIFASPTGGVLYPDGNGGNDTLFYAEFRSGYDAALIPHAISGNQGFPSGTMNRLHVQSELGLNGSGLYPPYAMGRGYWESTANQVRAMDAPVNIGADVQIDANRNLSVEVELYYTEEETEENFIHVAVLQDGIKSLQINWPDPQTGNTFYDSAYYQNNVLREYITGQWGDKVTGATTEGSRYNKTYNYTIPMNFIEHPQNRRGEGEAVLDDLSVVIFVSREKVNILNAIEVDVP